MPFSSNNRFKQVKDEVTLVIKVPSKDINNIRMLIRAYTMDGTELPSELQAILLSVYKGLPKG